MSAPTHTTSSYKHQLITDHDLDPYQRRDPGLITRVRLAAIIDNGNGNYQVILLRKIPYIRVAATELYDAKHRNFTVARVFGNTLRQHGISIVQDMHTIILAQPLPPNRTKIISAYDPNVNLTIPLRDYRLALEDGSHIHVDGTDPIVVEEYPEIQVCFDIATLTRKVNGVEEESSKAACALHLEYIPCKDVTLINVAATLLPCPQLEYLKDLRNFDLPTKTIKVAEEAQIEALAMARLRDLHHQPRIAATEAIPRLGKWGTEEEFTEAGEWKEVKKFCTKAGVEIEVDADADEDDILIAQQLGGEFSAYLTGE